MKRTWIAKIVYALLCNIPVSFCLCMASALANDHTNIDWENLFFNYSISLPIAIMITLFIPLVWLGKWFTNLFGVRHDTFTNNILYRVIAIFFYACIYFIILNPTLTLINLLMHGGWMPFEDFIFDWVRGIPFMVLVGFTSSIIFDIPAYRVAHRIDPNF